MYVFNMFLLISMKCVHDDRKIVREIIFVRVPISFRNFFS